MSVFNAALQCSRPGCYAIADTNGVCARHRQAARQAAGVCLNCAAELERTPEMNALTGRQLRRLGEPAWLLTCAAGCGYTRRPRPRL